MERTKKKSAFRTVLKWLVVAAIALAVLYHLPLRRSVSMTMQNQETGESAALSMELALRRSFFARTRVQGTLVFDGEPYTSVLKVTTDLSPLETLAAIYVGLQLFGLFGFLLGPIGLLIIKDFVEEYGDEDEGTVVYR